MEYETANYMLPQELQTTHFKISDLFVNLTDRDKNSEKWNHQIKFWSRFIRIWADQTHMIEFSLDKLSKSLLYNNEGIELIPNLMPTIDYLLKTGLLKSHDDVISDNSLLNKITSTVLGFVWPFGHKDADRYVIIDSLKKKADDIINEVTHYAIDCADLCLTKKQFESRFRCDDKYSLEVLEKALLKTKVVKKINDGYFFKNSRFEDFTEAAADVVIGTKRTIDDLDGKIDVLDNQIQSYEEKIREYLKKNRRVDAKSLLARRIQANKQNERYRQMRANLESSIMSIEQSHTTKKVLDSLKISHEQMKNMKMPDADEVDKVMDDIQYYTNDVLDDLSNAMNIANPVDEEAIDEELNNLCNEMQQENAVPEAQSQQQETIPHYPQPMAEPAYRIPYY